MDTAIAIGVTTAIAAQIATVVTLVINSRNTRLREEAVAQRLDVRAARDRKWAMEDRDALARTVQHNVEATAAVARSHVNALVAKVDQADAAAAIRAVDLTALVKENTEISTNAFHEANGAKLLIADTNKVLAEEVAKRNEIQAASDAAVSTHRRSTDPKDPREPKGLTP